MKLQSTLLLVSLLLLVVPASAADVFERYVEVIGLREQHNGLLAAGFDTAFLSAASVGPRTDSLDTEANRKRVKEIMIEELGFDAMRSNYVAEIRRLFSEQELSAVIADLEKPEVAAVLKRQAEAFAAMLAKIQLQAGSARMNRAKKRILHEVLGR